MKQAPVPHVICPDWPAPAQVRACVTTRRGGYSAAPYDSLNLGDHVGDVAATVAKNRAHVAAALGLPADLPWLTQVHGCEVAQLPCADLPPADAACTTQPRLPCVVMTADCLPVLFCSRQGDWVAAAHAGWRGLAQGVLEAVLARAPCPPEQLLAWLGPAIGPRAFQVGDEVRAAFVSQDAAAEDAFVQQDAQHYLADLYQLARLRLARRGLHAVYGGAFCTYEDQRRFFSYRRDGAATGRMASLIWLEK